MFNSESSANADSKTNLNISLKKVRIREKDIYDDTWGSDSGYYTVFLDAVTTKKDEFFIVGVEEDRGPGESTSLRVLFKDEYARFPSLRKAENHFNKMVRKYWAVKGQAFTKENTKNLKAARQK